jgi:hypothetical protein
LPDNIGCKRTEAGNKFNALAENICYVTVFRIRIKGIRGKNSAGNFIHDVGRRGLHDNVFRKVRRKGSYCSEICSKFVKLALCRKFSEKKEVGTLLKAKAFCSFCILYDVFYIITAVNEASWNSFFRAVRFNFITHYVTDSCKAYKNSASVCITETAFYVVFFIK